MIPVRRLRRQVTACHRQRPPPHTMTKHSKNNTASSIFSYAERKRLDYGTKGVRHLPPRSTLVLITRSCLQQRLGNESMRRFDACALCLQRARDPVACQEGHLFCKECAYTDLREFRDYPSTVFVLSDSFSGAKEGHKAAKRATGSAQEGSRTGKSKGQRSRERTCASRFREGSAGAHRRRRGHDLWSRGNR